MYIDEAVYRWNTKDYLEGERLADMMGKAMNVVTYEKVRAKKKTA